MYESDEEERYFHLFHSSTKEGDERALLACQKAPKMKSHLMKHTNEVIDFSPGFRHYYILHYNEQNRVFQFPEDRIDVIERENDLSGYFCIITSEKMTAKEALESRPNFMTVPAAIRELEKIEMVRLTDNRYRLDHAVTATQKTILKAFDMDANVIKHYAAEISRILKEAK